VKSIISGKTSGASASRLYSPFGRLYVKSGFVPSKSARGPPFASAASWTPGFDVTWKRTHANAPAFFRDSCHFAPFESAGPAEGKARLAGLVRAARWIPAARLPKPLERHLGELVRHLDRMASLETYRVVVARVEVAPQKTDSLFDSFDLVVAVKSARNPEQRTSVRKNTHKAMFEDPLFDAFAFQPFDAIEVRVLDDDRAAGFTVIDEGSLFALAKLETGVDDAQGVGSIALSFDPRPERPFSFDGWPR